MLKANTYEILNLTNNTQQVNVRNKMQKHKAVY